MENSVYNIKSLFALGDVQQLVIPEVQRDYVWEEKNCNRLFHSIKHAFDKRKADLPDYSLIPDEKIRVDLENKFIDDNSRVNLGFIYAYHDSDYIGKQFVIDGQQRFTTVYLLLLACYKTLNRSPDFSNTYFRSNKPKVDYKVRESSHDFIIELIKDQCLGNDIVNLEQRLWWRPDFDIDVTVRNVKNNYIFLLQQVSLISVDEQTAFLDYIERNIDFKFFDVAVSEQGEQLYLFMNSRGVKLTFQEKIRAEIISHHGLDFGVFWEDAQQYFWENKLDNKDAELGFNEFLKWSVIINIAVSNKDYSKYENLISRPTTDEQTELLESYFIDNINGFSQPYLEGIFKATKFLFDLSTIDSIQTNPIWLTSPDGSIMPMRIYLKLLPVIYYIFRKQSTDNLDLAELRRVAAFITNCSQSRTYQKNPQQYLLNFVGFIKDLCDDHTLASIMDFDTKSDLFIGRDFSKLYFATFNSLTSNADKELLENFIINMIVDAETNNTLDFLHGDYRLILQSLPPEKSMIENSNLMKSYCEKLNWFIGLDFNKQRKFLVTFGDYAFPLSDTKYDFGQKKESWGDIFTNPVKTPIYSSFLNFQQTLDDLGLNTKIADWMLQNPISSLIDEARFAFYMVKYDFDKNYFAWGWGPNAFTFRTHTVRKTGFNYSIDVMNYAVSQPFNGKVNNLGWVYGSRDKSEISISVNKQAGISMCYMPIDWNTGNWILKNNLDISNPDFNKINNVLQNTPPTNATVNDDVVDLGQKVLKYILDEI